MEKPKVSYADFVASLPKKPQRAAGTIAWIVQRYVDEMAAVKPVGTSQGYTLGIVQRMPIGAIQWLELAHTDVIDFARQRIDSGVCAATVMQGVTYLAGALKYAGSAWKDCFGCSDTAVATAKPFLKKHGLISKSTPRDRQPQDDEIERLRSYFRTPKSHGFDRRLPMELMMDWQLASGRRIGESCRLLWADWDRENQTILVRKMKDPKNRDKNKLVACTTEAQAMLVDLWEKRDPAEPRIFPVNAKSVGAAYTNAKNALGIVNLHLHDCRRRCITRLIQEKGYSSAETMCFSGHETPAVLERTYLKMDPTKVKDGPRARQVSA